MLGIFFFFYFSINLQVNSLPLLKVYCEQMCAAVPPTPNTTHRHSSLHDHSSVSGLRRGRKGTWLPGQMWLQLSVPGEPAG